MAKRKACAHDIRAPNVLPVDRHDIVTPNGATLPSDSAPTITRPRGAKSSKV